MARAADARAGARSDDEAAPADAGTEPSLGLAPVITDLTFQKIAEIHAMGTAILLVEQNAGRALTLVQRAYVLESGRVIMHGHSAELANNKQVQAAYLGI